MHSNAIPENNEKIVENVHSELNERKLQDLNPRFSLN